MTNGAPTSRCRDEQARTAEQADRIRALLAGGMDAPTVAAQVRCTLARVQDVAASGTSVPPAPERAVALPRPRQATEPRPTPRTGGQRPSWDLLLNRACRDDDPRIKALAAHIVDDLGTLRLLLEGADRRETAARVLVDEDRRAEALRRAYDGRHPGRRHTDRQEAGR